MDLDEIEMLQKEEFRLARHIKENHCDDTGKETDPAKAAQILFQIGLVYRKQSPDKIALIKSAGLFNAAIVRNPSNVSQIELDLSELCYHILEISNAMNHAADLIKKSEQVKSNIMVLRNEVRNIFKSKVPKITEISSITKLATLRKKKISVIQELNKLIALKYKQIMIELSQYCEDVMGKAPCEYAIVGMGSLAREEITPYSDFEHIILLRDDKNYKSNLEYFKWFSVIFHIVILNVQETIVPSLNICSLNDKTSSLGDWFYDAITPRGISFDGMMPHACKFPMGRQQHTKNKQFTTELIKPVSEMLEYLSSEADLKNGYHLADILTKTCFVFGNADIFKQFADGVQTFRDKKSQTSTINDIKKQVKQDLNSFSTRFRLSNLKSQHTINIKQLVYRSTTIFISALARKHNISANSCFDIIDEMAKSNEITQNGAEKLQFAIAVACEMRLRVYMEHNSQYDNAIDLKQDGIEKFLDIVGVACTINYFQIAYCLQCEVAKQLNFTKLHYYSNSQLINITIGLAFGINSFSRLIENSPTQLWNSSKFNFDTCIEQLESKMNIKALTEKSFGQFFFQKMPKFFQNSADSFRQTNLNSEQIKAIANNLVLAGTFDEALEFYKQLLVFDESKSKDITRDHDVETANHQIGFCLFKLNKPTEALVYLQRALKIRKRLTHDADNDKKFAMILHSIGTSHALLSNYDEAITYLDQALKIYQNTTQNAIIYKSIGSIYNDIGWCHIYLHNYDRALTHLYLAFEIYQNITTNPYEYKDSITTLTNIGWCHINLHNYDHALKNLSRALAIYQNSDADTIEIIAETFYVFGCCHNGLRNYAEALTNLTPAYEIKRDKSLDIDNDRELAEILLEMGRCFTGLQQFDDSWNRLQQAQKIFENTLLNHGKDIWIAHTFNFMGECQMGKQQYAEALIYLRKSREIYRTQINWQKNPVLAAALNNMGTCLMELLEYTDALNLFKESLKIYETFPLNEHIAGKLESIRCKLNKCSLKETCLR